MNRAQTKLISTRTKNTGLKWGSWCSDLMGLKMGIYILLQLTEAGERKLNEEE